MEFSNGGILEAESFVAGYPAAGSQVRYAPPPTHTHRRVPSTALSADAVLHGQVGFAVQCIIEFHKSE